MRSEFLFDTHIIFSPQKVNLICDMFLANYWMYSNTCSMTTKQHSQYVWDVTEKAHFYGSIQSSNKLKASKYKPTYNQKLYIPFIFTPFIKCKIIIFITIFSKESNSIRFNPISSSIQFH